MSADASKDVNDKKKDKKKKTKRPDIDLKRLTEGTIMLKFSSKSPPRETTIRLSPDMQFITYRGSWLNIFKKEESRRSIISIY